MFAFVKSTQYYHSHWLGYDSKYEIGNGIFKYRIYLIFTRIEFVNVLRIQGNGVCMGFVWEPAGILLQNVNNGSEKRLKLRIDN